MRSIFLISSLFTIVFLYSSCGKYVGDYNADFVGSWATEPMLTENGVEVRSYVKIDGNNSHYMYLCDGSNTCVAGTTGKAKINRKHTRLWIGDKSEASPLKIDQEPYLDTDGKWKCVLNGVPYIKD